MATQNQMTLILWNLKFILFINFIHFPNILSMSLAEVEAHIIVFYLIFDSVLKKRIVINNWAMNHFLSLSDLLNCYFLERNVHIGLKLLKSF